MKEQNITIDINKLATEQLEQLNKMFYEIGMMNECKQINERIAFLNGWMTEEKEEEYYNKYCA